MLGFEGKHSLNCSAGQLPILELVWWMQVHKLGGILYQLAASKNSFLARERSLEMVRQQEFGSGKQH